MIAVSSRDIVEIVVKFGVKSRAPCLNSRNAYRSRRKPLIFVGVVRRIDFEVFVEDAG